MLSSARQGDARQHGNQAGQYPQRVADVGQQVNGCGGVFGCHCVLSLGCCLLVAEHTLSVGGELSLVAGVILNGEFVRKFLDLDFEIWLGEWRGAESGPAEL